MRSYVVWGALAALACGPPCAWAQQAQTLPPRATEDAAAVKPPIDAARGVQPAAGDQPQERAVAAASDAGVPASARSPETPGSTAEAPATQTDPTIRSDPGKSATPAGPRTDDPAPLPQDKAKKNPPKVSLAERAGATVGGALASAAGGAVGGPLGGAAAGFVGNKIGLTFVRSVRRLFGGAKAEPAPIQQAAAPELMKGPRPD